MNTSETKPQQKLLSLIHGLGYDAEMEKHFAPYTVDIYLQKYHLAVEYDGKGWHTFSKQTVKRDAILAVKYQLQILHINEDNYCEAPALIEKFIQRWSFNAAERKKIYEGW